MRTFFLLVPLALVGLTYQAAHKIEIEIAIEGPRTMLIANTRPTRRFKRARIQSSKRLMNALALQLLPSAKPISITIQDEMTG